MQAFGRAAEVKLSGDGNEITKLIYLHCSEIQIKYGQKYIGSDQRARPRVSVRHRAADSIPRG
jgi:hypothetical protein